LQQFIFNQALLQNQHQVPLEAGPAPHVPAPLLLQRTLPANFGLPSPPPTPAADSSPPPPPVRTRSGPWQPFRTNIDERNILPGPSAQPGPSTSNQPSTTARLTRFASKRFKNLTKK
jgi:hypothetical protein